MTKIKNPTDIIQLFMLSTFCYKKKASSRVGRRKKKWFLFNQEHWRLEMAAKLYNLWPRHGQWKFTRTMMSSSKFHRRTSIERKREWTLLAFWKLTWPGLPGAYRASFSLKRTLFLGAIVYMMHVYIKPKKKCLIPPRKFSRLSSCDRRKV